MHTQILPQVFTMSALHDKILKIAKIFGRCLNTAARIMSVLTSNQSNQQYYGNTFIKVRQPCARNSLLSNRNEGAEMTRKDGWIYLIHAQGTSRYKIGRSIDPSKRLERLQQQCPFPLKLIATFYTDDCIADEGRLHRLAKVYCKHGEWFELPNKWIEAIDYWFQKKERLVPPDTKACFLSHKPTTEPFSIIAEREAAECEQKNRQFLPPRTPTGEKELDEAICLLGNRAKNDLKIKNKKRLVELIGIYPTVHDAQSWKRRLKKLRQQLNTF